MEHERALRLLAEEAESQGRHTEEIDLKRRLAVADPLGERPATDLVRALAAAGDWAGAARAAREYATRVREELPGASARDLEALVERLHTEHRRTAGEDERDAGGEPARYLVERELGRGSAAIVYLARDRRYDRPVALKLLRPEIATATDARRFRREIGILARLYHPHILQLYDSGVMPPGAGPPGLFYVMPYVRGESLRQRLQREIQLPIAEAVRIALDVADALAYAHGQGVVHRDIRPENILLESGQALVADFGIAGVLESAGGERLSASGIVLGDPGLHQSGTGARKPGPGRPERHLQPGLRALRDAGRRAPVQRVPAGLPCSPDTWPNPSHRSGPSGPTSRRRSSARCSGPWPSSRRSATRRPDELSRALRTV